MKKLTIVTGASSGMGREFALQLSARSDTDEIWLLARSKDKLEELAAELNEIRGKEENSKRPVPRTVEIDLGKRTGIERFSVLLAGAQAAESLNGGIRIQVLVNNAGFGTYGPFADTALNKELDMIDLNCTAVTGLCGKALPYMSNGSHIINVASLASYLPLGNFAVYGATKAYVLSFTTALAAEVKDKGISVCALCPGPVSTNFANIASNGARSEVKNGLPAEQVVSHCLKRAFSGKHTAVMAFKWKFKAFASRFIGRYTGARFTYKYCKRPSKPQA